MTARGRSFDTYVALVTVAGCSLLVWFAAQPSLEAAASERAFGLLALLLLVGEVFPISVPRGDEVDELTASTTFAFALMIGFGTPAAVVAQVIASMIADILLHKSPWKVAFNAGQYALSLGAAGVVYHGLGGGSSLSSSSILPFLASAITFFLLNTIITDVAVAMSSGVVMGPYIAKDLVFQAQATLPLLALAPVVVAAVDESLWLIPLAAAPAVALWWGTRLALENSRLAQELQRSLEQEQELNRMKDDFVAMVSHELRTPLTSIQGYIKTLRQLSSDLPSDQRDSFLEAADRQGDRLRRLIEQLLVVGRLETHVEPLAVTPISVDRLATNVVDELRLGARGHVFDVRIDPNLPRIRSDEGKVHQILSNLAENALKYTPPDTCVGIAADPAVGGIIVSVSDQGEGIPEEHRERIFERFYQVDGSATRRVGGTGLGLYICVKMAETLGGRIWLASSDEGGSVFSLFLPEVPPGFEDREDPPGPDQSMTARV
ncbi:MAG: sensor histidine kinase [Myxococcota bacterium]